MICIVSAFDKEIEPLVTELKAVKVDDSHWVVPDQNLVIGAVGIGYLEAAIGLEKLLSRYPNTSGVLFTGSAGVYPGVKTLQIGDLVTCRETLLCDGAAEIGLALYAAIMEKGPLAASLATDQDLYPARVATLISLTSDDQLAVSIQKSRDVELENMELYGIARVCEQKAICWNALLGVTNVVGAEGHLQWKQNFRQVAELAGQELIKLIKNGGFASV